MGSAGKAGMERTKKIGTFNTDGAGKVEVFSSKEGEGFDHGRQEGWAASRRVNTLIESPAETPGASLA